MATACDCLGFRAGFGRRGRRAVWGRSQRFVPPVGSLMLVDEVAAGAGLALSILVASVCSCCQGFLLMIQRYLLIGTLPELRPDPINAGDKNHPEIPVVIPMPEFWEIENLIHQMRYAKNEGLSTHTLWRKFSKKIYPYILLEKDRTWYKTNMDF